MIFISACFGIEKKESKNTILVYNIGNNLDKTTKEIERDKKLKDLIKKASGFIHKHKLQNRCYLKRPWGIYQYEDRWEIWFRRLNEDGTPFGGKPFRFCVIIEKNTDKIKFKPLK